MLGKRPTKYWEICWKFVSLLVIGVSLFVNKVMLSIRIDNEIQKNQYCNWCCFEWTIARKTLVIFYKVDDLFSDNGLDEYYYVHRTRTWWSDIFRLGKISWMAYSCISNRCHSRMVPAQILLGRRMEGEYDLFKFMRLYPYFRYKLKYMYRKNVGKDYIKCTIL